MTDEVMIYRVVGVALIYVILPARTAVRKRIRWGAAAFIGFGVCFVGWAASWPGPDSITAVMILVGLLTFLVSVCGLARACFFSGKSN